MLTCALLSAQALVPVQSYQLRTPFSMPCASHLRPPPRTLQCRPVLMQGQRRELEVVAQPLAALRFAAGRFGLALVGASRVLDGAVNLVATCAAWLVRVAFTALLLPVLATAWLLRHLGMSCCSRAATNVAAGGGRAAAEPRIPNSRPSHVEFEEGQRLAHAQMLQRSRGRPGSAPPAGEAKRKYLLLERRADGHVAPAATPAATQVTTQAATPAATAAPTPAAAVVASTEGGPAVPARQLAPNSPPSLASQARADGAARRASWMPHRPHGAEAAAATGGPAVSAAPARPSPTAASDAKGGVSAAAEDASGANKWLPPSFREAARK